MPIYHKVETVALHSLQNTLNSLSGEGYTNLKCDYVEVVGGFVVIATKEVGELEFIELRNEEME